MKIECPHQTSAWNPPLAPRVGFLVFAGGAVNVIAVIVVLPAPVALMVRRARPRAARKPDGVRA